MQFLSCLLTSVDLKTRVGILDTRSFAEDRSKEGTAKASIRQFTEILKNKGMGDIKRE